MFVFMYIEYQFYYYFEFSHSIVFFDKFCWIFYYYYCEYRFENITTTITTTNRMSSLYLMATLVKMKELVCVRLCVYISSFQKEPYFQIFIFFVLSINHFCVFMRSFACMHSFKFLYCFFFVI